MIKESDVELLLDLEAINTNSPKDTIRSFAECMEMDEERAEIVITDFRSSTMYQELKQKRRDSWKAVLDKLDEGSRKKMVETLVAVGWVSKENDDGTR